MFGFVQCLSPQQLSQLYFDFLRKPDLCRDGGWLSAAEDLLHLLILICQRINPTSFTKPGMWKEKRDQLVSSVKEKAAQEHTPS